MSLAELLTVLSICAALLSGAGWTARTLATSARGRRRPRARAGRPATPAARPEDAHLAELQRHLWPRSEWRAMELSGCPHPMLDGYPTAAAARAADLPGMLPCRCTCGQWHLYRRRRRRAVRMLPELRSRRR